MQGVIFMPRTRKNTALSLLFGLLCAILATLTGMLIIAAALTWLHLPEKRLRLLNQCVKIAAIVIGTCRCVKRGGETGLASGTALALFYTILGYAAYLAPGGGRFSATAMLGEMLIGSAVGGLTGAVRANMNPRRKN